MHKHIIFFDSDCLFCNKIMRTIFEKDRKNKFHFASLDNHRLTESLGIGNQHDKKSIVYYRMGKVFSLSSAVIKIAYDLGGIYKSISFCMKFVPSPLLNLGYNIIANNRYRISQNVECELPSETMKSRILN
jgi:predicted DCC family thiol-disulfide oxidoreductase YuxK